MFLHAHLIKPFSETVFYTPMLHGAEDAGESGGMLGLVDGVLEHMLQLSETGISMDLLPGISTLGLNIHPMLVHFPIALLTTFWLLDIIGTLRHRPNLRLVASWLLYLGAFGAVITAMAGLYAASTVPHGESVHAILERHETIGLTIATLATVLAIWRGIVGTALSTMGQSLQLFLATILVLCVFIGADLGGSMVYGHGVGVHSLQQDDDHHHHEHH